MEKHQLKENKKSKRCRKKRKTIIEMAERELWSGGWEEGSGRKKNRVILKKKTEKERIEEHNTKLEQRSR